MDSSRIEIPSSVEKWLITVTVMLVAVIEVLDITIVNVSLQQMMGAFGSTVQQITWVVTAYVIAAAVMMPLTGLLVDNFGRKRLLLVSTMGFMIASILCGCSTSLIEIVIFRALQGMFGAVLIPLSQLIIESTFSKKELDKAMAVWVMGIMVAPVLGPTLGGYITEHLDWRWVFLINVPVCIVAFVLTLRLITESPLNRKPIDWLGLVFLATCIGCLQSFLEEGAHYDWFSSNIILFLFIAALFFISAFIIQSMSNPNAIIKLSIFKNRQFMSCTLIFTLYALSLFGMMVLQPIMHLVLMGYPATQTGLVMAPRGLASFLLIGLVPILMKYIDSKILIAIGLLLTGIGSFLMARWNLQTNMVTMAWEPSLQGFGMALVLAPISTILFATLPSSDKATAAGIFSFGRSIGLSIGVAIFTTVLTTQTQVNWNRLGGYLNSFNAHLGHWLNMQHLNLQSPIAVNGLAHELYQQAGMIAYADIYWLSGVIFMAMIPLVLLIDRGSC